MNISVLGCGRWGTFLASYLCGSHDVMLWGREGSQRFQQLCAERKNQYITLPEKLKLQPDLSTAVAHGEIIVISISAQALASLADRLNQLDLSGKIFVLCMKGIEVASGRRLTEVLRSHVSQKVGLAVWVGPGHVQDFSAGIPNCMVVDSDDPKVIDRVVDTLSSDLIRLYKGNDLIGTEVGAAAKNVIGIAAGMLDGAGLTSLKGALMARGAREVGRLIKAMGGNEISAYGLCHLGDYQATLFSEYSHNRQFGENTIRGEKYDLLAEGAATVKAMVALGQKYQVDLPISNAVYRILYEQCDPQQVLKSLFSRKVKEEFYV